MLCSYKLDKRLRNYNKKVFKFYNKDIIDEYQKCQCLPEHVLFIFFVFYIFLAHVIK